MPAEVPTGVNSDPPRPIALGRACLGALARAAGAQSLSAMTVGFDEAEFDESALTRRTASSPPRRLRATEP